MKLLIIANWKMNPTSVQEAKRLFKAVAFKVKSLKLKVKNYEIVICPPLTQLSAISYQLSANIKLGAQNVFWEERGPFTGEISPKMLKDIGCKYVIVGHSERRQYFKENDEMVNKKIKAAIEVGLNVILCIGEKEGEDVGTVLKTQITKGLEGFPESKIKLLNIAYEPVWAIGTGNFCEPSQALEANLFIRRILTKIFDQKLAEKIRILYGGSVNSKISGSYIKEAEMEGLLVGGASLDPKEFGEIVKSVNDQ